MRRHEKIKPHLVDQYQYQRDRFEELWVRSWFTWYTDIQDTTVGTIFSDRFKK